MTLFTRLATAIILWACGALAHAGLITATGGSSLTTGGNNDVLGAGVLGSIGGNLSLAGPAFLTYTFLGNEAAWANTYVATGDSGSGGFANVSSTIGDSFAVRQSTAGLLDFRFITPRNGDVANGSNSLITPHFFVHVLSDTAVIIALDDGGAGPDSDYDDLVVRVDAVRAPEPATVAMILVGLACLGLGRRRSRMRIESTRSA